ncbi:MAG: CDP-diacylglycerol--glycerol-3-phosphate 3-phosphatidyltransferase [Lentisphaeria bacterium]|nr:CDP-diacylglycerol--glycerol-3-phosphate 3-phosphatidyltransferase [Lentisphaeria bacterium]
MNIPNILTVARVVIILVFVVLASLAGGEFYSADKMPGSILLIRGTAYALAIIAALTDLLDGYLARRWNQITDFGALMDPLADKVFITATMIIAVYYQLMPAWIVILVLSREFMVTGLRTMAAKRGVVIAADRWGKLKTFLQMLMLALAGASWIGLYNLKDKSFSFHGILLWDLWLLFLIAIVLITVLSGLGYFIRYREVFLPGTEQK